MRLPIASEGSYSPDGSRLAYVPLQQWQRAWKRYRGGQTKRIWLVHLATLNVEAVPRDNSNDFNPMWVGDAVYFLSDRNGAVTLFKYDTRGKQVTQVVRNTGLDVKSAAAGAGAIVYERFGEIHLLDLETAQTRSVPIRVEGDLPALRRVSRKLTSSVGPLAISPTVARAAFESHGEIDRPRRQR